MPSSGPINGTDFRMYVNGTAVGYSTNCSFSTDTEILEAIHKDGAGSGWRTITLGQQSASMTVDAFVNEDATTLGYGHDVDDIASLKFNKTLVSWAFKAQSGDDKFTGTGYIVSFSIDTPAEDNSTYSFTLEVTGAITLGTVT